MDELKTLIGIRTRRLEEAERRVNLAVGALYQAQQEVLQKEQQLADYEQKLPGLVDGIYLQIMGKKADVKTVEEAVLKEKKLYTVREDHVAQVAQAKKVLEEKEIAVTAARQHRQKEENRRDGLVDVKKEADQLKRIENERKEAKILDELATVKFVAQHGCKKG